MTHNFSRSTVIAIVLAVIGTRSIHAADGGATPDATFEAFKSAMKEKDFRKGFAQTTPESQEIMLGGMAMGMSFMAMDPAKGPEINKIFEKHSIKKPDLTNPAAVQQDPKGAFKQLVADVKDKPAAIADVLQFMEANAGQQGQQAATTQADELASATLADVKIDGDSATAMVKLNSSDPTKATPRPMMFKKIGDVWLVDFAALADKALKPAEAK